MDQVKWVMAGLVARRREMGLRQADIAALVGVGQQHVSHWERGQSLTIDGLFAYAEAVDMEVVLGLRSRSSGSYAPDRRP